MNPAGNEATTRPAGPGSDRRAMGILFVFFAVLYGYFFQGGGWNPNSHFDTIRALVETGSLEITPYAANTGDKSVVDGRVYANKPPGLAFAGAPLYAVLATLERRAGLSLGNRWVVNANAHALAFFTSGLPAAVLVCLLYTHFRRRAHPPGTALALSAAFGLGSLALPFAGLLMNHNLVACCLFASWVLVTGGNVSRPALVASGLLAGEAFLSDYLAGPLMALLCVLAFSRHRTRRRWLWFLVGPCMAVLVFMLVNERCFGGPFITAYSVQAARFRDARLWLGTMGPPRLVRLYWLTFHPMRGLFYFCPLFLVCFFGLRKGGMRLRLDGSRLFPPFVVAYYLLFNLCFNGWTGGWGIGPRYLIPALPFLFLAAASGWSRWKTVRRLIVTVSCVNMLVAAAVWVQVPTPDSGPALDINPLGIDYGLLLEGRVSVNPQGMLDRGPLLDAHGRPLDAWTSYNLGELLGLEGTLSLVPILAWLALFLAVAFFGGRAPCWSGGRLRVHS